MHTPVLLDRAIEALQIKPNGQYIDGTAGEGGHLGMIVHKGGKVLAIDLDEAQVQNLQARYKTDDVKLVQGNFANIEEIANDNEFYPVDGILLDLGLSMKQINSSGKGFSFKALNDPLDMRLDNSTEETAFDIINSYSENDLFDLFARYSEDLNSKKVAESIVVQRKFKKITTVQDLNEVIDKSIPEGEQKNRVYARIFQALRIAVNHEFENIRAALKGGLNILKPEGRLVIITFHSLEDRIVKQYARIHGVKMIEQKIEYNEIQSFERSAKLRVLVKN